MAIAAVLLRGPVTGRRQRLSPRKLKPQGSQIIQPGEDLLFFPSVSVRGLMAFVRLIGAG